MKKIELAAKHHKEPCIKCDKLTAWHRPENPRKIWAKQIYVCFECVENYRETSRAAWGSVSGRRVA